MKGKSTMDAVERVLRIAADVKYGRSVQGHRWCLLVTLDVKNAFNSASWWKILNQLEERGVSPYLFNIVKDYFTNRTILYDNISESTSTGIPQGSVVGTLLWNLYYDAVLRQQYPEGVEVIGFADDLAIVAQSGEADDLLYKTNRAVQTVATWMQQKGLELAQEKTELLLLNGKRDRSRISITVSGKEIKPSKTVKYLGFHVQIATSKAEERLSTLARVMQNVGGPSCEKRLLLYGVVQSIILNGAHVWGGILCIQKYRSMLEKLQRRAVLRVISGYRTISTDAVQVLVGILPIHHLILERTRLDNKRVAEGMGERQWQRSVD